MDLIALSTKQLLLAIPQQLHVKITAQMLHNRQHHGWGAEVTKLGIPNERDARTFAMHQQSAQPDFHCGLSAASEQIECSKPFQARQPAGASWMWTWLRTLFLSSDCMKMTPAAGKVMREMCVG